MTEKITITQEQADEVASFTGEFGYTPLNFHEAFYGRTKYRNNFNSKIAESIQDVTGMGEHNEFGILQKLYAGDYEIEQPTLKVGDWATRIKTTGSGMSNHSKGYTFQIQSFAELASEKHAVGNNDWAHKISNLRHSTPEEVKVEKERQKWAEIGREVGEIFHGDIGISNSGQRILSKTEIEAAYKHGSLIGLYPNESIVSFVEEVESIVEAPSY